MTSITFIKRFLLHCIWALSATVVVLFFMEFVIPGSVTPYADPLPWAVIAIAALSVDAMIRPIAPKRWFRPALGIALLILSLLMISTGINAWGKSTTILIFVMGLMIGMIVWFASGRNAEP